MICAQFPKWKVVAFVVLSVSDFALTYLLLENHGSAVYESNPLAEQTLQLGGWIGLAMFKAAVVLFVMGLAMYLYRRRPKIASDVLAVACGATVVAVLSGIAIAVTPAEEHDFERFKTAVQGDAHAEARMRPVEERRQDYGSLFDETAGKLSMNLCTLQEAVRTMQATDLARDPVWRKALKRAYPAVNDRALIAADLMQRAVGNYLRNAMAREIAQRLESEFRGMYGEVPVLPYQQLLHLVPPPGNRLPMSTDDINPKIQ